MAIRSIRQQPNLIVQNENDQWQISDAFFLEFHVTDRVLDYLSDDTILPADRMNMISPMNINVRSFLIRRYDLLVSQTSAFRHLSSMLSLMGIPFDFHASIVQLIRFDYFFVELSIYRHRSSSYDRYSCHHGFKVYK